MPKSKACLLSLWEKWPRHLASLVLEPRLQKAPQWPDDFAAFCIRDPQGRPLRQGQVHRDLQTFLTKERRALFELPRDHGKSVQMCICLLWELGHAPESRIKIVCASEAMAAERSRFLRDALAHNIPLHLVFPHLRPAQPWSMDRFSVERPANIIGPSVTALGVGAASTGTRADILVCDDIVDVKALASQAERERVKTCFRENLMNLLEPDGRFWGLFTPWHLDDLNSELKRNSSYVLFRRAVGDDLQPVWPEKWPAERLEERRREIGEVPFARAYRLRCVPDDDVPMRAPWIKHWSAPAEYNLIVLSVDPAVARHSRADYSALVTLGRTAGKEIHCLEAVARRVTTPDLIGLIDDADHRYRPHVILFESNAAFAGIHDLMMRQARFGQRVKAVVQTRDKLSRMHAFSVPVENGAFRLKGVTVNQVDPGQQALFDEMTTFPFAEHDDLLDAAATGTAYLLDQFEPRAW